MLYNGLDVEQEAAMNVAKLMAVSARTAPKGRGQDNIEVLILDGSEKDTLSLAMRDIAETTGESFYSRDANGIDSSHCIVIIGVRNTPLGLDNCSYCGFKDCQEMAGAGANCAFNITDLGVAVGSAVSVAAAHNIDNRVMFSAGKAAVQLGFMPADVRVCYGIPLASSGKNIFYDRG